MESLLSSPARRTWQETMPTFCYLFIGQPTMLISRNELFCFLLLISVLMVEGSWQSPVLQEHRVFPFSFIRSMLQPVKNSRYIRQQNYEQRKLSCMWFLCINRKLWINITPPSRYSLCLFQTYHGLMVNSLSHKTTTMESVWPPISTKSWCYSQENGSSR